MNDFVRAARNTETRDRIQRQVQEEWKKLSRWKRFWYSHNKLDKELWELEIESYVIMKILSETVDQVENIWKKALNKK